jgi:N-acetylneuraminate synthase
VGLSDHSGKIAPALYGAMIGIDLLELHVTPHPLFFGPDIKASLSFDEVGEVLRLMEDFKVLQASRMTKDELFENSRATAEIFGRAIYWARNLTVGEKISLDSLAFLKPAGIGIPAMKYEDLIGKTTSQSVTKGKLVSLEDYS